MTSKCSCLTPPSRSIEDIIACYSKCSGASEDFENERQQIEQKFSLAFYRYSINIGLASVALISGIASKYFLYQAERYDSMSKVRQEPLLEQEAKRYYRYAQYTRSVLFVAIAGLVGNLYFKNFL